MTLDALKQDIRYALRGLRAKPGFAAAVVVTLALGIGANAAMFGIVDRMLFRPPPLLKDPETAHRVYLYRTNRGTERPGGVSQYSRYRDLATLTTSFSNEAGHTTRQLAVGVGDAAREMQIGIVSAGFFSFFDAPTVKGRYFTAAEDRPTNAADVAVLSYAMWQTRYGGIESILDSTIQIGPMKLSIIGVAPPGFVGLWPNQPPVAFVPMTTYAVSQNFKPRTSTWWETYSWGWMDMIVRRKPGVSITAANTDVSNAFSKSYDKQLIEQPRVTPKNIAKPRAIVGSILPSRGPNASAVSKVATWVAGMSVIVLLIACANVANLLLARALRRRREIAMRLALGVTRGRLLSQLMTESLLLAVLGGVVGMMIAHWGGAALRATLLPNSEAPSGFQDLRTVGYAALAALTVGLLTGLAPILQARRADLTNDLKAGTREGTYGRSKMRIGLLIVQGALSVILLVGAGLFVRSLGNVRDIRLGYDVDPIMIADLNMRGVEMDSASRAALRRRLLEVSTSIPVVQNASLQVGVPFWSSWSNNLFVEGIDTVFRYGNFMLNPVSPSYFETFGTRLLRGRGIEATDIDGGPKVMVVSQKMGQVLFPGRDPIGQCVRMNADTMPCHTVVGIAEDIKAGSLKPDSNFYYYIAATQFSPQTGGLFIRVRNGTAKQHLETVRRRLQQEMPGASYVKLTPFGEIMGQQTQSWRLGATMFVAFGVLALVLAAVGLYSVIAYNVTQRQHELGVRVALGAKGPDVIRLVVTDGLKVVGVGVTVGLVVALWAGKFVQPLLFSVSPRDPSVFVLVATTLVGVAIAASWIPARRASRVDPNVVLRSD
ncbi:MAG TPA: ADOP family duplicated permease [Gemmatimonadaceae bacterium]